jgi:hypothetical protein
MKGLFAILLAAISIAGGRVAVEALRSPGIAIRRSDVTLTYAPRPPSPILEVRAQGQARARCSRGLPRAVEAPAAVSSSGTADRAPPAPCCTRGVRGRADRGRRFVDDPASLITASDLVSSIPIGTGFAGRRRRPAAKDFYCVNRRPLGDGGLHPALARPLWRGAFADLPGGRELRRLARGGDGGTSGAARREGGGIVLISGGVAVGEATPRPLQTALRIPNRTAAALFHGRLGEGLAKDREAATKAAEAWARDVYAPALARIDTLGDAEREAVAAGLARYTGYPLAQIDRKTLTVTPRQYLSGLLKDQGKTLNTFDMRGHRRRRQKGRGAA